MHHIHILWHHTTLFMTSHALYSWHHFHYILYSIHCFCVITTPLFMISRQLYVWRHTHFIYDILCTIHNVTSTLGVHTIVVTTLHPLHSWHHTHYIWHHTHDNTNVISAISPTISDTISTVSVSSNPGYQLYHTHSLNSITHIICITSYSVCMALHELFKTSHPYMYDITPSIFMTSYPIYMVSPILLSWQHNDYTCHLTHYIWHHRHCICVVNLLYRWHHNKYGNHHSWHTYDIMNTQHDITFTLYDINPHHLWHHNHSFHEIRSPIYDIRSRFMASHPLYLWHHSHSTWNIKPTMVVNSHPLYLRSNTLC